MAAVFLEGWVHLPQFDIRRLNIFLCRWIFLILSLLGLRQWLARVMPQSPVMAVGAGIGFFIAFIGLCESLRARLLSRHPT